MSNIKNNQIIKQNVKFGEHLAPFCPCCGSGEYLHNPDGNLNDFCGQCGTPLEWDIMENVDTDTLVDMKNDMDIRFYE